MKNTVLLTIILFILIGCAHKPTQKPVVNAPAYSAPLGEVENKPKELGKTRAIFHVIEPLGIQLVLLNVKTQKEEIVQMDLTLSQLELAPGHWQVAGFVLDGQRYGVMNISKQFIFQLKKDKVTYVGSYIFQCPKVNETHLKEMKKMSFFNRYPFSSETRLCELVVGSDFDKVKQVWKNIDKTKLRPLSLGF